MRKIRTGIFVIMTMAAMSSAEAAVMTPAIARLPGNFSVNEKIGCVLPGGACPWGRHRVCSGTVCSCTPCGGFWSLWHRYTDQTR
jgi:hypothetical protein